MTDPRIDAVAEWMRDRENGSTGWLNTSEHHKEYLRREAEYVLVVADEADPLRKILAELHTGPSYNLKPIDLDRPQT